MYRVFLKDALHGRVELVGVAAVEPVGVAAELVGVVSVELVGVAAVELVEVAAELVGVAAVEPVKVSAVELWE